MYHEESKVKTHSVVAHIMYEDMFDALARSVPFKILYNFHHDTATYIAIFWILYIIS